MAEEIICYEVGRKRPRSKFWLVWKCLRMPGTGPASKPHTTKLEIASRDLSYEDAHAFAKRKNEAERGR